MNGITDEQDDILSQNRSILDQIQSIDTSQDDNHQLLLLLKEGLEGLPTKSAIVDVLQEIKQQTLDTPIPSSFENDPQMMRLDNMLLSEGIAGPEKLIHFPNMGETPAEQLEYQEKILVFRKIYQEELSLYEKACKEFKDHVIELLDHQAMLRPVPPAEKQMLLTSIQLRFQGIQMQLKESMCQGVMLLRSKIFDARRKRRNFSKTATEILNEYFYNNLANPYPNEDVKEQLAVKCNITVVQVSNWFGNKRIRYKKNYVPPPMEESAVQGTSGDEDDKTGILPDDIATTNAQLMDQSL